MWDKGWLTEARPCFCKARKWLIGRACRVAVMFPINPCTSHPEILRPCHARALRSRASEPRRGGVLDCSPDRTRTFPSNDAHPVSRNREALRAETGRSATEKSGSYRREIPASEPGPELPSSKCPYRLRADQSTSGPPRKQCCVGQSRGGLHPCPPSPTASPGR